MTKKWKDVAWPFSPNEANSGQEEREHIIIIPPLRVKYVADIV